MHYKYDKQALGNQRDHGSYLYCCVYNSVMHITITCSDAKDNIDSVIIFLQLRNDRLSFAS